MRDLICPYICNNKTVYGYCKTTACINLEYNKIYTISKQTLRILTNKESSKIQQERDRGGDR